MTPEHKPTGTAIIPYMQTVSGKISRLLAKYNIKTVHQLARKTNTMLRQVKDSLGRNVPGIYHIPCDVAKCTLAKQGAL
jgi:hypothetical protein